MADYTTVCCNTKKKLILICDMHAHIYNFFHTGEQGFPPRLPDLTKNNISLILGNAAKAKYTCFIQ